MRGTDDERARHSPIVVSVSDAPSYAQRATTAHSRKPLPRAEARYPVTDVGLRPRLATDCPGSLPAQPSQRSACFAPRRASEYVNRSVAPFASPTSVPHMSQTRTVFLATSISLFVVGSSSPGRETKTKFSYDRSQTNSFLQSTGFHAVRTCRSRD